MEEDGHVVVVEEAKILWRSSRESSAPRVSLAGVLSLESQQKLDIHRSQSEN